MQKHRLCFMCTGFASAFNYYYFPFFLAHVCFCRLLTSEIPLFVEAGSCYIYAHLRRKKNQHGKLLIPSWIPALYIIYVLIKEKTICGGDEKGEDRRASECWQEGTSEQVLMYFYKMWVLCKKNKLLLGP